MKLLILGSKEYPLGTSDDPLRSGGFEIYTQNLVAHLGKRVQAVTIITRKFKDTPAYERNGNIEIYRVPWIRGFYFRNPSFNLASFLKALSLDFDVILSHGPISSFLAGILSSIKKKKLVAIPAGVAHTQPQYPGILRRVLYLLENLTYRNADVVVFLSKAERDKFKSHLGYLPGKHRIIPTGVESKEIDKDEIEKLKSRFGIKGITITFVGRLIGVKGVDVLLSALRDVGTDMKNDFTALIVGDGPDRKKLENLVKDYDLENRVVFTGWRTDVPAILAASDIFVLPSYSEGLPIALLEAMAAGRACIVTDIALPVDDGTDALVVQPGDARRLKDALKRLTEDSDLRTRLGKNAKKKAETEFSWERAGDGYLELFKDCLP